ncbi:cytoplasmic dynein 1 intermediate chain-like isoform X5 [Limulus polyphemus]|uniref:Cytoplasmic dynein 1 intermediate chain-like isoform X5 n=1 Tax=Limulus polyphemus TaxID=6850 RepID=A0ABM1TFH2_LIMPO|nr:cytoplasmic dynein 1 intermediate chain-like isoform X5 [Limulus polyphemus]
MDRRAELERKKQKLAMIREEKERRRREKEAKEHEEIVTRITKPDKDLRAETEELLSSLGIPLGNDGSLIRSLNATPETSLSPIPDQSLTSTQSGTGLLKSSRRQVKLSVVSVHQANIPPKESVTYNKQTQTATSTIDKEGSLSSSPFKENGLFWRTRKAHPLDYYDDGHFVFPTRLEWDDEFQVEEEGEGCSLPSNDSESPALYPRHHGPHKVAGLPKIEMVRPAHVAEGDNPLTPGHADLQKKVTGTQDLSEEEKQQIMMSEEFHSFFDKASRIVERALYEDIDICVDYTGIGEEQEGDDKSGIRLSVNRCFVDDRWSKNRTITSFDWSAQFPELLVASYNNNEDVPHDPDGVCLIWNLKFKKTTPEHIFHCQSPVMAACFAKFHPNLILGGTYSGQVVLWDNRSNKRTPVQRSPLSASAHTHPVYCVHVVGTQNAHNLVSISTDGKFCSWSLDMLSTPQDTMELTHQKQSRAVAVTSLSFPYGEFNNFVVGSEEGSVYTACRHGSKAGVMEMFEAHQGPVTGIDTHRAQGHIDFSHLFLTSSIDWTVKLWSLKESKPVYSFEDNGDYVYDVSWSPIHPALFACVDGMGRLDLWNLNNDTELPTASVVLDGSPALNRVMWAPAGHQVVVGDDAGKIWIYDVGEQLATPKSDEWTMFMHTLQELKNNQVDQDLDALTSLSSSGFSSGIR